MDVPGSSDAVIYIVASTFLGVFVAVAISNLVDYESVPLYAIILSVLWLLIVTPLQRPPGQPFSRVCEPLAMTAVFLWLLSGL